MKFTGNDLVLWLRQALYITSLIPMLPAVIFHMRQHNYTQLSQIYDNGIFSSINAAGQITIKLFGVPEDFAESIGLKQA